LVFSLAHLASATVNDYGCCPARAPADGETVKACKRWAKLAGRTAGARPHHL